MNSDEYFTDEEVGLITEALNSRRVEVFTLGLLSLEKVTRELRKHVNAVESKDEMKVLSVISLESDQSNIITKEQVISIGERQIDLTDMITKDGKLKKRRISKKQLSPEEIKEKLRKLRESRDDIPMKTCEVCGYRTREPYKMRRHERTHTGEKPFKCPLCPFRGAEKSVVVKHLKSNVHSKKPNLLNVKGGAANGMGIRIDCDQCSFTASSSQQMLKHKHARHEGAVRKVGKLSCPYCDYRNSYQKVMDLHIKAHQDEGTAVENQTRPHKEQSDQDDGIVTVFIEDFMTTSKPATIAQEAPDTQTSANDDGVEELLTSINS